MPGLARERLPNQRWAETSLAPHPHRLELKGAPSAISWPNVCAHCGGRADELIEVRKNFARRPRRHGNSGGALSPYLSAKARIPFCGGCAQQHQATQVKTSGVKRLFGAIFHPLFIPIAGSLFFLKVLLPDAQKTSPFEPNGWASWGLVGLFVFIIVWTGFLLWRMATNYGATPQTDITRSCDFSQDVSQLFEGKRHIYSMRNETFANALATLNADRVWTDQDQAGSRKRMYATSIAIIGALVLAYVLTYIFRW